MEFGLRHLSLSRAIIERHAADKKKQTIFRPSSPRARFRVALVECITRARDNILTTGPGAYTPEGQLASSANC